MVVDYYKTLELNKTATEDDIKKSYKKLAKKYHPDLNKEPGAEEKFKKINEAYQVLSDQQKKSNYDQYGSADGANSPFTGDSRSPFDIFNSFFSQEDEDNGFNSGFQDVFQQQSQPISKHQVNLTFLQSVKGCDYKFTYKSNINCSSCKGKKSLNGEKSYIFKCSACHGSGHEIIQIRNFFGNINKRQTCRKCLGAGETITKKCISCKGNGFVAQQKSVEVKLAAGIKDLETLVFTDSNSFDKQKIYLQIHVQGSMIFERKGENIYTKIIINPLTAIFGGQAEVPTINGIKTIKIDAGTQLGTYLKLNGLGVKGNKRNNDGHLFIKVEFAELKLDKEQKEILKSLKITTLKETES